MSADDLALAGHGGFAVTALESEVKRQLGYLIAEQEEITRYLKLIFEAEERAEIYQSRANDCQLALDRLFGRSVNSA